MQAVVLTAGAGTRMRPLSATTPKPMLPVADRPLVAHPMDAAVAAGCDELILVVGAADGPVRAAVGDRFAGVPVTYAVQDEPRGTADAVRAAADAIDGPFLVLNGDNLYDRDAVQGLVDAWPGVAAVRVDDPSNYGVLTTRDSHVEGVVEKPADPPTDLVNAGAYSFPEAACDWLAVDESDRGEFELTDVLSRTAEARAVTPVTVDRWLDVGRPWELLAANEWALEGLSPRIDGTVSPDATVEGPVVVEAGATVRSGVVVEGPAYLAEGATVGPNAYVRGTTYLGPGATVGHAVEVKNSLLFEGATVGHQSYVGDSILGRHVNFGAGTNTANLRHDDEPVTMQVKGETVSTGRRKFGVVAGDGAKTGIDTSLNAGVALSPGATTTPGETVLTDR